MNIQAHAKINISLNVVRRREDGYHDLEMIMVPLTLHDEIELSLAKEDQFTCSDKQLCMDKNNTVVKAVELMRTTFSLSQHFHVHVIKNIPAQAGLAGGSADAAAVMRGIRELLQLDVSMEELAQLGKQVGADVPFCVMETCALVKGIGEDITPFVMPKDFHILLVKPSRGVPTGKAFSMLDFQQCAHPDGIAVMTCLQNNDIEHLSSVIANSLEYSAFQLVPEIRDIKRELQDMGFAAVLMSGSGSTVFAITRDEQLLKKAAKKMQRNDTFVCMTAIP